MQSIWLYQTYLVKTSLLHNKVYLTKFFLLDKYQLNESNSMPGN